MKNTYATITCLLISVMTGSVFSNEKAPVRMKQSTSEKLREKLADKSGKISYPPFETFILEDDRGQEIPISSVPSRVVTEGEQWMRKLVRAEWLPDDVMGQLKARKDALVREIPRADGQPGFKEFGDFLILDYEIKAHQILLIESGKTLSARIKLPEETNLPKVTGKDILKLVSTFFTLPETAIHPDDIKIEGDDQLRSFRWTKGPTPEETSRRFITGESLDWWFRLQLHFDGQTLLISIPEIDNPPRLSPRITLQDRF